MTIEEATELLKDVPDFSQRRMFGGYGLYSGARIFALLDDGDVYLKGDSISAPLYEASGGRQFSYMSKDGPMTLRYWRLPDEELLLGHVQDALDTLGRTPPPKPKKPKGQSLKGKRNQI